MQPSSKWIKGAVLVFALTATLLAQSSAPAKPTTKKAAPKPNPTLQEIEELKALIQAQQQQITQQGQQVDQLRIQLQQVLDSSQQANTAAQKAQANVDQVQTAASQAQQSATQAQQLATQAQASATQAASSVVAVTTRTTEEDKQISALEALVSRFRFTGDIRLRTEAFKQDLTPDRNREQLRVRFGVEGQLNEDFKAGFAIATGSLSNPTTANEALSNFFERKTIGLDRGYITYNPVGFSALSLTGGKFAYQWQRTSVTGDPDINPEGFNEKLSFDLHSPVIKNLTVQAIQLLYNESSSSTDSYALGGQVSGRFQFGPWTTTPSFMILNWNNPNALLNVSASQLTSEGPGCVVPTDTPTGTCAFGPNGMTNATITNAAGKAAFYSGFDYADLIINNQIKTGASRLPLNLVAEYEHNLKAADHPLDSAGVVLTNLGSQANEYGGDFSIGQLKNKNDVQFGYAWLRQEQDSVLAAFAESDQRAPTNIVQNRIYALWKLRANTVAGVTWWHGHTLNTDLENAARASATKVLPGEQDPYLNRFQFDLLYSF
jgi:TolA-binding protein